MTCPSISPHLKRLIELAYQEDVGPGDLTTRALVPHSAVGSGRVLARETLVLSGLEPALAAFHFLDPGLQVQAYASDGDLLEPCDVLLEASGSIASLLTAERTVLNFLQRLSGVATLTRRYVEALAGSRTRLLDTRKTTPGWRAIEKAAVRHGGGHNHRFALFDGVLIKDNHLVAVGGVSGAVKLAREHAPSLVRIEVEVETIGQLVEAIEADADVVMLDNMSDEQIAEAVRLANGRVQLEASGGITLERLPKLGALGVDFVSCGAVTHSAPAVDIAFEIDEGYLV